MDKKVKILLILGVGVTVIGTLAYFLLRKPAATIAPTTGSSSGSTPTNSSPTPTGTTVPPSSLPSAWVNFDWIGSNFGGLSGVHCYPKSPEGVAAGSKVEIKVTSGDSSYNGVWDVEDVGDDNGSYTESMVVINKPVTKKECIGQFRLVG